MMMLLKDGELVPLGQWYDTLGWLEGMVLHDMMLDDARMDL